MGEIITTFDKNWSYRPKSIAIDEKKYPPVSQLCVVADQNKFYLQIRLRLPQSFVKRKNVFVYQTKFGAFLELLRGYLKRR